MTADHLLAIDQGTTSTRVILFDRAGRVISVAQRELAQSYPTEGWVEQDAETIWRDTLMTMREAIAASGLPLPRVAGIGIANQRETTVVWDRETGVPIHPAIVWQDRRTGDLCSALRKDGIEPDVRAKTGLVLDPYFSATKIAWLLDNVPGARGRAERGELAFGTIDCFLLWRLTGGKVHATDATNASRTMLYDIERHSWDEELCRIFRTPMSLLPEVRDTSGVYGATERGILDAELPIGALAGDQQAALFGQACFEPGSAKATFGTGAFLLLNTGGQLVRSESGLLSTIAWQIDGTASYALEGSIFVAGAAIQWLRDALGILATSAESEAAAASLSDNGGVYLVPAFVGLGAPHWLPSARAAITGLTFQANRSHLIRAALESAAYQTADLVEAMVTDGAAARAVLKIDGGMSGNGWFTQFLADMLQVSVERAQNREATALGAAFLAGVALGVYSGTSELRRIAASGARQAPAMDGEERDKLLSEWRRAVRHVAG